jgi:GABA(A) receptor-associated protein
MTFKERFSFDFRKEESIKIRNKYPNKIPVVCEKLYSSDPDINKIKYLLPVEVTLAYFIFLIRKNYILKQNEGIFLIINGFIPPSSYCFSKLYDLFSEDDGFLYINYSVESVFGG